MDIEHIQSLLQQSNQLYTKRSLKQALAIAEQALDQSLHQTYHSGQVYSNLLIGRIHNTAAKYQGDPSIFPLAIKYLQKASQLNQPPNENGATIDILLSLGEVHENKKEFQEAEELYLQALQKSRKKEDIAGVIQSLCRISQLCVQKNEFTEALEYAEQSHDFLKEKEATANQVLLAQIYNQLSSVYLKRQDYNRLLEFSQPLLDISRSIGAIELELNALNNIAIYHGVKSDYKASMQYLIEALEKSKQINYRNNTAQYLINIGTIYAILFNRSEALKRYETALHEYSDVLKDNSRVILYNNIGNIHANNNDPKAAQTYFKQALELAEACNYKEMIAHSLAQLSRTEAAMGRIDEAYELALKAADTMEDLGDINGRQINLSNLGHIYFHRQEYQQAIKYASNSIVTSKRMKDDANELRGYQLLANIYNETGDFEKALQYQMIYSSKHEQFASLQMHRQVTDMEIKYAIQDKQRQIEQLTKENEFQSLLLEQSDQIAKQNAQLLQVNEELRQFAYVASHDLKEPLRMIGSYTQLIERLHSKQFNEDSKQYFAFVSEGVIRMNNLLDALLKYATIGKTEEDMEEVELIDVVDIAIINLRVRIEETQAEIHRTDLPAIRSSQSLLIQLFQNLISNALKFRKADSKSIVHIETQQTEEEVIVSVRDNGIGISPEYKERIFVIFQRLHTRNKYEGTGIGLAICQKIVQQLNGRIWVESALGEGATFFVALPR